MTEITFAWPIVAGKEEEWRRLLQELEGSRSGDFGRMRRHLGICKIGIWLQLTRHGEMALVHAEVDDPAEAISVLADSKVTFEIWLGRKVEEFHGVAVERVRSNAAPELVFRAGPKKKA